MFTKNPVLSSFQTDQKYRTPHLFGTQCLLWVLLLFECVVRCVHTKRGDVTPVGSFLLCEVLDWQSYQHACGIVTR